MSDARAAPNPKWLLASSAKSHAPPSSARLWQVLMSTRVALGLVLAVAAVVLSIFGGASTPLAALCVAYASYAVYERVRGQAPSSLAQFDRHWPRSVGVDVLMFAGIHGAQIAGLNYASLFILPVLTAAVLGSSLLSMATAAAASLFLLADAWWFTTAAGDMTPRLAQAGLFGMGFFGVALTAHPLAQRLAEEEALARASESVARMQTLVNQHVIEVLSDGVLMVDANGVVHSLNPAAQRMLQPPGRAARSAPFVLAGEASWHELAQLAAQSFVQGEQTTEIMVRWPDAAPRRLLAKSKMVNLVGNPGTALCVVYLEDLRDIEARVRTEKLAAMGRMSAAVAHEIRNPLAAISQANGLLAEGELAATQQRLVRIIHTNSQRLGRIVNDVLSVSRADGSGVSAQWHSLSLRADLEAIADEWRMQNGVGSRLEVISIPDCTVRFQSEHLRQVMVNLLDNAARYASSGVASIRLYAELQVNEVSVCVWSDGQPLDASVQAHLFEPFFSSESRSSGLGLFISRELCERHGASISYQRLHHSGQAGNCFEVRCLVVDAPANRPIDGVALLSQGPNPGSSFFNSSL